MRILYFGDFDPEYSRNRTIIKGLREHGLEVMLCNVRAEGFQKYYSLWQEHQKLKNAYDALIVGYTDSRWMTLLARMISRRVVIWDGFFSIYDSWVFDRKLVAPGSLKARWYWLLDWMNCRLADLILTDTQAYGDYFAETFHIFREKLLRVFVGTDLDLFQPAKTADAAQQDSFLVHFHGNFIPLQGVQFIVEAADILRDKQIAFQIIGSGQTFPEIMKKAEALQLKNISFIPRVPLHELPLYMRRAHICLGIFGDTQKAQRVIPNKAYEAIASAKALISADTPAMRELFTERQNILFCKSGNAHDLAQKILELKENPELRDHIAQGG